MGIFKKINYRKFSLQITAVLMFAVWFAGFQGCAYNTGNIATLPESPWGGKYAYSYNPTSVKAAKAVPITVAVVNPFYREKESLFDNKKYLNVGKGLSASMGADLDKILISKGVTTTGPFPSLEEITYSQKKDATLTLDPTVFVSAEIKALADAQHVYGANRTEQRFAMNITGWVSFSMREPLSGQKMWIKKLEMEPVQVEAMIYTESNPIYAPDGCGGQIVAGYRPGTIVYDGTVDAIADALKQMYPVILSQFEKYIDTEELLVLKEKGKEIRALKVY